MQKYNKFLTYTRGKSNLQVILGIFRVIIVNFCALE